MAPDHDAGRGPEQPIWRPSAERIAASTVERFRHHLAASGTTDVADTHDLHRFSCEHPGRFWRSVWEFSGIVGDPGTRDLIAPTFSGTQFFPEGSVDVAATMLAGDPDDVVVVECNEAGTASRLTRRELTRRVASLGAVMRRHGVGTGDVVAAYATTSAATLTAMLAAAACGAVVTTVSAEFGVDAVVERLSQVSPKALFTVGRYTFGGRSHRLQGRVEEILSAVDSVELVVAADWDDIGADATVGRRWVGVPYEEAIADPAASLATAPVAFNSPGSILYSSGTTGRPKCIVHRAGGVLLKHLSEMLLHCDIRPGDRLFYYTTPSWMMWNWLVSGLATGAAIVLYDGSPLVPDPAQLLAMAERESVTYFGTSPAFVEAVQRAGVDVGRFDLDAMRTVATTGSPLSPATARVAATWGSDVQVLSKSGGTDLCGGLLTGDPTRPVWPGEIQAPAYGCDIAVVDDTGVDVEVGTTGELVSRTAFPSMPLGLLGDDDGSKLRAAYFDRYPGCWHQADFVSETEHGGYVVHGRSDTTLNARGVRIGTAEIYFQLARMSWIRAAAAVEQHAEPSSRVVLLIELGGGVALDDERRHEIRSTLRERCSPRHVPDLVVAVDELPRTMNGKVSELAVADAINGRPVRAVAGLANPSTIEILGALGHRLASVARDGEPG